MRAFVYVCVGVFVCMLCVCVGVYVVNQLNYKFVYLNAIVENLIDFYE